MNHRAFMLGLFATGSQVLLLRELVSSLNGDELFIGTALFGWLIWAALGAVLGGKVGFSARTGTLFVAGALTLPVILIVTRLAPIFVTSVVGEIIPFSSAAVVSTVVMLPVGIISGWLFSAIANLNDKASSSIVTVYLWEGIGAFVAGLIVTFLAGSVFSTLAMSFLIGVVTLGFSFVLRFDVRKSGLVFGLLSVLLLSVAVTIAAGRLDKVIDGLKYDTYRVEQSFDTPYGHQAILTRAECVMLLTDNNIEAVWPDLNTAENILIPPLVYKPRANEILYVGRSEFGVGKLVDSFPGVSVTAVDPRGQIAEKIEEFLDPSESIVRIDRDPVALLSGIESDTAFDVVILNQGQFDNYRNSRLLTTRFLETVKSVLKEDGILFVPTRYDTDRYITGDVKELLSIISNTLKQAFEHVALWPGEMTLFFASETPLFDTPYDSITTCLLRLPYSTQYIHENYLIDRLSEFKMARLNDGITTVDKINSLERPLLPHYQAWYRAKADSIDRALMALVLRKPAWMIGLPILLLIVLVRLAVVGRGGRPYGLFLYLVAGLVSLSLELVSFYLYQSMAGSLYSEIAVLIGTFMLGLALGTYVTLKMAHKGAEYPALSTLLVATILLLFTCQRIQPQLLLIYHVLFLFTVALATGSLFVAATNRYYRGRSQSNRGIGYACELAGSSAGALLATTFLLPVIGLNWLLVSIAALLVTTMVGSIFSTRSG